ncbi:MAG TPA: hypothetical protein VGQ99_17545, partial [Tepidisphaeraceae bacterium]|nr:hypothetical protein [Tepidisphaeraceae bacterium]
MSLPHQGLRSGQGRARSASSIAGGRNRTGSSRIRQACRALFEKLEDRRLLSGDFRLIGITGNQQNSAYLDETLYNISVGTVGTSDPIFLDGFSDIPSNLPDTVLSIRTDVGVSQGKAALRVEVEPDVNAYWGIMSPNVLDLLKAGASQLSYELTLNNIDLNGGSFGGGADNSFTGYAQNNALAVVINTPSNGFIQRDFSSGGGTDSLGTNATWSGVDGVRTITWDLSQFTSADGMSLADFITANNATQARFWIVTQGAGDTNGHVGPMRFYFDNFQVTGPAGPKVIGDFELLDSSPFLTTPFVPDTDAIGFNPETGLLHRTSGASTYRNGPGSHLRVGYRDDHFMETIDVNSPFLTQVGIFNANYEGEPGFGPYGLDAPFPGWLFPATRRTDEQEDDSFGANGPDEYHSLRDLTWSTSDHVFYGADEDGIYRLTADGISTFVGLPLDAFGIKLNHGPKGITFHTFEGQRRLLITERDGGRLFQIDPATGQTINQIEMLDPNGFPLAGVLSIVEDPASAMLLAIVKPNGFSGDPFARELYQIDPITGTSISLGAFGVHMADLAFIVGPPAVTDAQFVYQNAPQRLTFTFDQNVGDSITPGDLSIVRLGPGGGPVVFADPVYDIAANTLTVAFNGILPDGNYRATFSASSVTNTLDMPLAANQVLDFFVLNGDL